MADKNSDLNILKDKFNLEIDLITKQKTMKSKLTTILILVTLAWIGYNVNKNMNKLKNSFEKVQNIL